MKQEESSLNNGGTTSVKALLLLLNEISPNVGFHYFFLDSDSDFGLWTP